MAVDIAIAVGQPTASNNRQITTKGAYGVNQGEATAAVRFVDCEIIAQIGASDAEDVEILVQRSPIDPATVDSNYDVPWAPAGAAMTGDPGSGILPNVYLESGVGWWRFFVTAADDPVTLTLTGKS